MEMDGNSPAATQTSCTHRQVAAQPETMFLIPLKVRSGTPSYFLELRCFLGIGISFYGDIDGDTEGEMVKASIVVDNGPPVMFAPSPQQQLTDITNNNQYFYTDELEQGEHTITITALNNNTVWIDYFLVVPGEVSVAPTTTGTPPALPSSTSRGQSINVGVILGGTIGGISILAALLSLLFWVRRRKQSQVESHHVSPGK